MCRKMWGFESLRGHQVIKTPLIRQRGFSFLRLHFFAVKIDKRFTLRLRRIPTVLFVLLYFFLHSSVAVKHDNITTRFILLRLF
jgi:hypothetical protein